MFQPPKRVRDQQLEQETTAATVAAQQSGGVSAQVEPSGPSSSSSAPRPFVRPSSLSRYDSHDSDEGFVLLSPHDASHQEFERVEQLEGATGGREQPPDSLSIPVHSHASSHTALIFGGAPTLALPDHTDSFSPLFVSPSSAMEAQAVRHAQSTEQHQHHHRPLPHSSSSGGLSMPPLFRGATDFAMPIPGASPRANTARSQAHTRAEPIPSGWTQIALHPTRPVVSKQAPLRSSRPSLNEYDDDETALHDQWTVSALAQRGGGKARLRVAGGVDHSRKSHKQTRAHQRQLIDDELHTTEPACPEPSAQEVAKIQAKASALAAKRAQQLERALRQRETQQAVARARDLTHASRLIPEPNEAQSRHESAWSSRSGPSPAVVESEDDRYEQWLSAWNQRVARGEVRDVGSRRRVEGDRDAAGELQRLREMREEELDQYLSYLALADEHARHVDQRLRDEAEEEALARLQVQPDATPDYGFDPDLHARISDNGSGSSRRVFLPSPQSRAAALASPYDATDRSVVGAAPRRAVPPTALGGVSALVRTDLGAAGTGDPFQRVWAKHWMVKNMTVNKKCKRNYNHPVKPKGSRQMETLNNSRNMRSDAFALHGLQDDQQDSD